MKTITMFEAKDEKRFMSAAECLEYEQQCVDLDAANDMLKNGSTLMAAITRANPTRPWWDSLLTLEDKVILSKSTKYTRFVLYGNPCRTRRLQVGVNGVVYVILYSDDNQETVQYGNLVKLSYLLSYARATESEHV